MPKKNRTTGPYRSQQFNKNEELKTTTEGGNGVITDLDADAWGRQIMSLDLSLFHGMWTYDIPASFWILKEDLIEVIPSTATRISSLGGALELKSGATNGNSASIHSKRHPRYQPNRGHKYSTAMYIPTPELTNCIRRFGLFNINGSLTPEDGTYFELDSTGLYACLSSNGVQTKKELIDLSIVGLVLSDLDKGVLYDIQFQWRSAGPFFFYINLKLVHTIENLGLHTGPSISNPALAATYQCINTSAGQDVILKSGCIDITSEGGKKAGQTYISATNDIGTGTGRSISGYDQPLIIIKIPETFNTKLNTRDVHLLRATASANQKCIMKVHITRDATAFGGTVGLGGLIQLRSDSPIEWIDCTNLSATEITLDKTKVNTVFEERVPLDDSKSVENPSNLVDFISVHNDYIILTGQRETGGACNMFGAIEMGEEI